MSNCMVLQEIQPQQIDGFFRQLEPGVVQAFRFNLKQWYLPKQPYLSLLVIVVVDDRQLGKIRLVVTTASADVELSIDCGNTLAELAEIWQAPLLDLSEPMKLEPVSVAKPWGKEIWYTGMEQRGLSLVSDGRYSIPLAWLIGIVPMQMMGKSDGMPDLLKILDPLPEVVYGDLYFELHQEKREIYVVTHIDEQAWPDGVGGIRYGFSPEKIKTYSDASDFRAAYLAIVMAYRAVRDEVDGLTDDMRRRDGFALDAPVSVWQSKQWQQELPVELNEREASARRAMEQFTQLRPLQVGDVVKIPLLVPHALQHGVRTVEFQSPVYERKILSFCQKVLTQSGWDTSEAVEMMSLAADENSDLAIIEEDSMLTHEIVARFSDFEVQRLTLKKGGIWTLTRSNTHRLLMSISGPLGVEGGGGAQILEQEQAIFIPAKCDDLRLKGLTDQPCMVLISQPS